MLSSSFGAWKALFIHKNGVKLFAELWKSHASWRHFGDGFKEVLGQKLAKKGAPDGANCMSPCTSFWPCQKLRVHLPSPCSCPPLNVSACFDANSRAVNNLLLLQMLFRLSAALSLSLFFVRPGKSVPFPFPIAFLSRLGCLSIFLFLWATNIAPVAHTSGKRKRKRRQFYLA